MEALEVFVDNSKEEFAIENVEWFLNQVKNYFGFLSSTFQIHFTLTNMARLRLQLLYEFTNSASLEAAPYFKIESTRSSLKAEIEL